MVMARWVFHNYYSIASPWYLCKVYPHQLARHDVGVVPDKAARASQWIASLGTIPHVLCEDWCSAVAVVLAMHLVHVVLDHQLAIVSVLVHKLGAGARVVEDDIVEELTAC